MVVTKIEEISSSRCKVTIDDEFAFVLYKGELRLYKLAQGREISGECFQTINTVVLPKRAKLRAMNLLAKREYSTARLKEKLRDGYYSESVIDDTISFLEENHYLDDFRYAECYISQYESSRSKQRIRQDLLKVGISADLIEKAMLHWEDENGPIDQQNLIKELLRKRKYDPFEADFKTKQREFAFLLRKGFTADEVRKALDISTFSV